MKSIKLVSILGIVMMLAVAGSAGAASGGKGVHWSYEGKGGPANWGHLKKEFSACSEGRMQSPFDIIPSTAVAAPLPAIETNYRSTTLQVINNGHAIQANYEGGSSAKLGGKEYNLLQFHFHGPSEYKVNGRAYPLEAHLVHKSDDGKLGVIGIFFKEGKKNELLQKIWDGTPNSVGVLRRSEDVKINVADLLPENRRYYHFTGSLTTPPCSEGVDWNVMVTPVEASKEQIAFFKKFYKMNARPVQPVNDRKIEVGGE